MKKPKTAYELMFESLREKFPNVIDEKRSENIEITLRDGNYAHITLRNSGNITLTRSNGRPSYAIEPEKHIAWENKQVMKLQKIRDHLLTLGYKPKIETSWIGKKCKGGLPFQIPFHLTEHLMYDVSVGRSKLLHHIGNKRIVVQENELYDRVYIGFLGHSWDGGEQWQWDK